MCSHFYTFGSAGGHAADRPGVREDGRMDEYLRARARHELEPRCVLVAEDRAAGGSACGCSGRPRDAGVDTPNRSSAEALAPEQHVLGTLLLLHCRHLEPCEGEGRRANSLGGAAAWPRKRKQQVCGRCARTCRNISSSSAAASRARSADRTMLAGKSNRSIPYCWRISASRRNVSPYASSSA